MAPGTKQNGKIDKQIEETFPASDPPSFMGGEVLGAPAGRHTSWRSKTGASKPHKPAQKGKAAKKKNRVKKPAAKKPAKKKKRATKKRTSR
jgi:hypothetical protein